MIPSLCNVRVHPLRPRPRTHRRAKSSKRLIGLLETAVDSGREPALVFPPDDGHVCDHCRKESRSPGRGARALSDRAPETRRGATAAGRHAWRRRRGQCFLPRIAQPCRQLLPAPSRAFAAATSEKGTRRPQDIPVDDLPPSCAGPPPTSRAGIPATSSLLQRRSRPRPNHCRPSHPRLTDAGIALPAARPAPAKTTPSSCHRFRHPGSGGNISTRGHRPRVAFGHA